MKEKRKKGHWTYERCKKEALKYDNIKDFQKNSSGARNAIYKNKWIELTSHIEPKHKPNGFWSFEQCEKEAKKYNSRIGFQIGSGSAYVISKKKGWLNLICVHMKTQVNKRKRLVYVFEFSDNFCYVGLQTFLQKQ